MATFAAGLDAFKFGTLCVLVWSAGLGMPSGTADGYEQQWPS
ncbi:hypothetical protein RSSM_05485 [Rhodopirellula sallentina SM41]|uniref:Uncharacterized protein n=1 Tax=Rhodopirellula sallentina SM41 TaxID=1263870 RepID=M5TVI9_9BACT|nr:hypothetical protein RSSM_05485 [Rhodopirellula sallentina SM41]